MLHVTCCKSTAFYGLCKISASFSPVFSSFRDVFMVCTKFFCFSFANS